MTKSTCYTNGRILKNHSLIQEDLWVEDGKIVEAKLNADEIIDVKNLIIAPGYIDLQLNGAFGIDFSQEPDLIHEVAKKLPQYGTTAFLPTLVSLDKDSYKKALPYLKTSNAENEASILGVHLEGPFFGVNKQGAHNKNLIQDKIIDIESFYEDLSFVKIITLAPELEGALEAISFLKSKNIIVSLGHTNANYSQAKNAFEAGANFATHLFNAMPPLHHRDPGIVGFVLDHTLFYSLIVDGAHLSPTIVSLCWKANPEGLILITDAMTAMGLTDGLYKLGSMEVEVKDSVAYVKGTNTIAGSMISLDAAVRNFKSFTGASSVDAIESASLKPAKLLGIEKQKGTLNIGSDADFILLDDDLFVQATFINGNQYIAKDV